MPHVIVKLWPGKSERQKEALADGVTKAVMASLAYGAAAVSVSLEEVPPAEWSAKVHEPDIINGVGKLYKKPGYDPR
jgi:4-oxalocrotonate tautomerase